MQKAAQVIGDDRENYQRDLANSIDNQDFPKWTLKVQVILRSGRGSNLTIRSVILLRSWPHADYR
ncbi:catalase [Vibrio lentus]|nr:catalase [Vibrio lentus]